MRPASALLRCFPACVQNTAACRSDGDRRCEPVQAARSRNLPFGWSPVRLGPSPIGRGRRTSWRPPQPADETCIVKAGRPYSIESKNLNPQHPLFGQRLKDLNCAGCFQVAVLGRQTVFASTPRGPLPTEHRPLRARPGIRCVRYSGANLLWSCERVASRAPPAPDIPATLHLSLCSP